MAPDRLLLPEGTRLVHIGPHKTATTAVQSAFHLARSELRAQGAHYAGPDRHAVTAVQAAIETARPDGRRVHPIGPWRRLLAEVGGSPAKRVVVSSEWFSDAQDDAIPRIVNELGAGSVHIVLTVRPLVRLLPSQWQEYVKAGWRVPYAEWLASVFDGAGDSVTQTFWRRHRHDRLAARWADVVGPDRVTVIVLDEADRGSILRTFEALLGIRSGTLVAEASRGNRSLTAAEAELVRALNAALRDEIPDQNLRLNLGLYGAAAALAARPPGADEPRIHTPAWAVAHATEVELEIVDGLAGSGVRVIGDVRKLLDEPQEGQATPESAEAAPDPWTTWPRLAAVAGLGVLSATGLARGGPAAAPRRAGELVRQLSTERLRRVVAQRLKGRVGRLLERRRGPGAPDPEPPPADRALTRAETEVLARFADELCAAGLPDQLYRHLIRDGLTTELRRRAGVTPDEAPSPALGASLALGVIRASGLIPGGHRRLPPPRARIETSEVAIVPTATLLVVVVGRLIRARFNRRGRTTSWSKPAAILRR